MKKNNNDKKKGKVIDMFDYDYDNLIRNLDVDFTVQKIRGFKDTEKTKEIPPFNVEKKFDNLMLRIERDKYYKLKKRIRICSVSVCSFFIIAFLTIMFTPDSPTAGDNDLFHQIRLLKDRLFITNEKTNESTKNLPDGVEAPPAQNDLYTENYNSYEELIKEEETSLYVPSFIPEGYSVQSIEYNYEWISKIEHIITRYFNDNKQLLTIIQVDILDRENKASRTCINNFLKTITINNNEVILAKGDDYFGAYFYLNNTKITITGDVTEEEMIKIIEGLKISPSE